ncbi:ABC transporter permease [Halomonas sp. LR3S48]|uniref:ABC transporter permease n=1 Tax=Halomonadaceae TaxID=28256 RepID=UPI0021E4C640|nr:ABC transporter permease [Halomonas sp. LR3S48]UYG02562.1 ABC transporter permease [Halomonas sp. LR3S48]
MPIFILRRVAVLVLALLVVTFLVFLIPYIGETDPVRALARARFGRLDLDAATIEALRLELGMHRPLIVQYLDWLRSAVTGDFGNSYMSREPVVEQVWSALKVSVVLTLASLGFAFAVAVPAGSIAALRRGGSFDMATKSLSQAFVAVPEYWLAPMSILVFALYLGWLPSAGWRGPESVILPALALSLRPMGYFTQVMRASMIDVLNSPHIVAAHSRGLSVRRTLIAHGLRNALLPVITLFSVWMAGLLGGAVVIEVIFAVPGMGRLVYSAIVNGDIPVLQAGLVAIVTLAVVINTVTDLAYTVLNPVVRIDNATA